jgi:hypothetical protein
MQKGIFVVVIRVLDEQGLHVADILNVFVELFLVLGLDEIERENILLIDQTKLPPALYPDEQLIQHFE